MNRYVPNWSIKRLIKFDLFDIRNFTASFGRGCLSGGNNGGVYVWSVGEYGKEFWCDRSGWVQTERKANGKRKRQ